MIYLRIESEFVCRLWVARPSGKVDSHAGGAEVPQMALDLLPALRPLPLTMYQNIWVQVTGARMTRVLFSECVLV